MMSKTESFVGQKMTKLVLISALLAAFMLGILAFMSGTAAAGQETALAPEEDSMVYMPMIIGSAMQPPSTSYQDDFTDTIAPWAARRWTKGADYVIKHNDECNDGHCGFLDVKVNSSQAYVIASPMEAVAAPFIYDVRARAKLLDRDDGDEYGIIYGANWTSNGCPANDFSTCFTEYYEFRVRYRDDNGDKFLEWKLKRVEGHDENNQNFGPDIIDWKRLDGVNPDSWVNWKIEVHNNGQMNIFANNVKQAGSAKDATYINNHYFGLMGRSSGNGGSHVLFDRMIIE